MFQRFLYISFRLIGIFNRFISRRFTKGGQLVLAGIVASAVVGVDTNQTVAYQSFTFLLSLLAVSIFCSLFFRADFEVKRVLPQFGTAGEEFTYRVRIRNRSLTNQKGLRLFENIDPSLPSYEEFLETRKQKDQGENRFEQTMGYYRWVRLVSQRQARFKKKLALPDLLADGLEEIRIDIVPPKRGRLRFTGLTFARPDPLGLIHSFHHIKAPQSVIILPKRYHLPEVRLPGARRYHSGGVALASSVGDSEEFMSMRDYRPGDPLRRIHWKSWAKVGKPIVKEYQDEFFVRHALVLDTFSGVAYSDILEEAVSVAASFACSIQTQDSLLDLMFVGPEAYCFTSGRGLSHTDNTLEILSSVGACVDKPFAALQPIVIERSSMLSSCICILLAWDEERKNLIDHLLAIGVPTKVFVITSQGQTALDDGSMAKEKPEYLQLLETGSVQKGLSGI